MVDLLSVISLYNLSRNPQRVFPWNLGHIETCHINCEDQFEKLNALYNTGVEKVLCSLTCMPAQQA